MKNVIKFFPYNTRCVLEMGDTYKVFETVSEAVNYCNENNIEAEVVCR